MTHRRVLFLVLAALVLSACSLALAVRLSDDLRAAASRRLFSFSLAECVWVRIDRADAEPVELFFDDVRGWQVRLPDGLADDLAPGARAQLEALASLAWREPLPAGIAANEPAAAVLTARTVSGREQVFEFGARSGSLQAVRTDGQTYAVGTGLTRFLGWPALRWRSLQLAVVPGLRPVRIALAPAGANPDLRIELRSTPGGWRMTAPYDWPADAFRVDKLTGWLDRLTADSIAAEQFPDQAWMGFGPASAWVEADYPDLAGGVRTVRVEFGRVEQGQGQYARVVGRTPVFFINPALCAEISLTEAEGFPAQWRSFWRQRSFNALGNQEPQEIVVERLTGMPQSVVLRRVLAQGAQRWVGVLRTGGEEREFAVDDPAQGPGPLATLIAGLSNIRVSGFTDAPASGEPAWRFTIRGGPEGENHVITLFADPDIFPEGSAAPVDIESRRKNGVVPPLAFSYDELPAVMQMHGDLGWLLCLPPWRYQSAKMHALDADAWTRVDIAADGKSKTYTRPAEEINRQWYANGAALLDSNNAFVELLFDLAALTGRGLVAANIDAAANFGLDRPAITAIVYISGPDSAADAGRVFRLDIGQEAENTGGCRYAMLDGRGPVFLVPARLADALHRAAD